MLIRAEKSITKEQYEKARLNGSFVSEADLQEIFSQSELYGYGVLEPIVHKIYNEATGGTTYIVSYITSTNCD